MDYGIMQAQSSVTVKGTPIYRNQIFSQLNAPTIIDNSNSTTPKINYKTLDLTKTMHVKQIYNLESWTPRTIENDSTPGGTTNSYIGLQTLKFTDLKQPNAKSVPKSARMLTPST